MDPLIGWHLSCAIGTPLGRVAAKRVFTAVDDEMRSGIEYLPVRLVIRGSTFPRR